MSLDDATIGGLERVLVDRDVLVCAGSGGVGKTTLAASIGLAAASLGRRVCVVTIDPARRLADTLDLDHDLDRPHRIAGPWKGELDAVMLDARRTFDALVTRYANDEAQTERILSNPIYLSLVTTLGGTQEYMATEKLYELHAEGGYDLVVVDTPPSRHALDFLEAPSRLRGFLDNKVLRLLLGPGRAGLRAVSIGARLLLKSLARVAGAEIVDDTIAFFQAFEGMDAGFKARAASVERLLSADSTGFVLITTPRRDAALEATFFAERLVKRGRGADLVIVNRAPPRPLGVDLPLPSNDGARRDDYDLLVANYEEISCLSANEEAVLSPLRRATPGAGELLVPHLSSDVHDVTGLELVARHLLGREVRFGDGEDPAR